MNVSESQLIAPRLLAWWDQHGRKDLPWQQQITPYRVWVSEIMLQQTQVATVIDYFQRFMQRFPTLPDLAAADADDVMQLWAGLGYYSRARNLLRCAQICQEQYDGGLPKNADLLCELPGIGRSTAAAIMSLSHDEPHAILDGNVKRVLARYHAVEGWPGASKVQNELWAIAEAHTPDKRAANYTQAIMDLGATLCTPKKPDCKHCPVSQTCEALAKDEVARFPERKPRKTTPVRSAYVILHSNESGQLLLERRPPSGIWGGLWCLPMSDSESTLTNADSSAPAFKHTFTHFKLVMTPLQVTQPPTDGPVQDREGQRWVSAEDLPGLGLPKPIKTLLTQYFEEQLEWQKLLTA